jgi:hypothetical protein
MCKGIRKSSSPGGAIGFLCGVVASVCLMIGVPAMGEVITFDDLVASPNYSLRGSHYAGLTWEEGNIGLDGYLGSWAVASGASTYPHSLPNIAGNGYGCTLLGITFPFPVNMQGSYIAHAGNGLQTNAVRVHGYLAGQPTLSTEWFTPIYAGGVWFEMSVLTNVDRIVFESVPYDYRNAGWYGIDDLTFTYVPEPAGLGLLSLAGLTLLPRRRAGP